MKKCIPLFFFSLCTFGFTGVKKATTLQIDIAAILNARPVTVLSHGKLFTWAKGIDGVYDKFPFIWF